jgi:L,D-transpeptidase catalytic domain
LASVNRSTGIFNAFWDLYCYFYERGLVQQRVGQRPDAALYFFMADGHAIHGSYEVKTLGKPVSHGCVRISPQNATTLYGLVGKSGLKNTQVVLTGVTPGGESKVASRAAPSRMPSAKPKVASKAGPRSRYVQAVPSWNGRGDELQRRRGFFGRLFGGP